MKVKFLQGKDLCEENNRRVESTWEFWIKKTLDELIMIQSARQLKKLRLGDEDWNEASIILWKLLTHDLLLDDKSSRN